MTEEQEIYGPKLLLLSDSVNGQYGPQYVASSYDLMSAISDKQILADAIKIVRVGPTHEDYWEAWLDVEASAYISHQDALYWIESHDGNIWAVREDFTDIERGKRGW